MGVGKEVEVDVLKLDPAGVAVLALARGVALLLALHALLQHLLLGVDHDLDAGGLPPLLVDVDGYLPPAGEAEGGLGHFGIGVVDDVGGVVLVLLLVEEEDGLRC